MTTVKGDWDRSVTIGFDWDLQWPAASSDFFAGKHFHRGHTQRLLYNTTHGHTCQDRAIRIRCMAVGLN